MVLVDTSVLIDYLAGNENEKTKKFDEIINLNVPFGINLYIYQELLQGTRTEQDFYLLKRFLDSQKFFYLKNGKESYANAAKIYFDCKKKGQNLALNIENKGYPVVVFNRTGSKTQDFVNTSAKGKNITAVYSIKDLVGSLEKPRIIILMVKAGRPVDDTICQLVQWLGQGDLIIDW